MCSKCANRVEIAFDLKTECENSDIKLREILQLRKLAEEAEHEPNGYPDNVYVTNYALEYKEELTAVDEKVGELTVVTNIENTASRVNDAVDETTNVKLEDLTTEELEYNLVNNSSECSNSSEKGNLVVGDGDDDEKANLTCEYCDRSFRNSASLSNHMRKHKGLFDLSALKTIRLLRIFQQTCMYHLRASIYDVRGWDDYKKSENSWLRYILFFNIIPCKLNEFHYSFLFDDIAVCFKL